MLIETKVVVKTQPLKQWIALKVHADWLVKRQISCVIIQQIVTLSKYGHDALDICHPQVTDIRRYT